MKLAVRLFAVVFLILCLFAPTSLLAKEKDKRTIRIGYIMLPFETTGLEDIHASDWQNYGLGAIEGRVNLPLTKGKASGLHPGFVLGFEEWLADLPYLPPFLAEVQYAATGEADLFGFFLGVNLKPQLNLTGDEKFSIGFIPKVGYMRGNIDFGKVEVLPGKTPPVITPEGTFYTGDEISAKVSGIAIQAALNASYSLTKSLSIGGQFGWSQALFGDMKIKAGDITLDMDSPVLVKKDLSSAQAGIDPKAESSGLLLALTLDYKF